MNFEREPDARPTGTLVTDALQHLSRLIKGEVSLARAEVEQGLRKAAGGIMFLIAGAVVAVAALNVVAFAAVAALASASDLSTGAAALVVGAILAVVAVMLFWLGKSYVSPLRLSPTRTLKNIRQDAETLKEIVTNDPVK